MYLQGKWSKALSSATDILPGMNTVHVFSVGQIG